jgi:aspartate/methionine/tyrosine aminotransferase
VDEPVNDRQAAGPADSGYAASGATDAPRPLSRRANLMPRSAIREIMALAAGRPEVIHLEVGEPDFGTPSHIVEQAFAAVRDGATRYTGNAGRPSLRAAVAARASRSGVTVAAERVVVTVGAVGALFTALMSVIDAGDEVLIPDPGWPNCWRGACRSATRCRRAPASCRIPAI